MKDFRQMVDTYVLDHEKHKKYLAFVLALSMMVTFAVPLSLMQPAESMTANREFLGTELARAQTNASLHPVSCSDPNCTNDAHEYTEVELLVGQNPPDELKGATTVDDAVDKADRAYALGIASQFCVFVEGSFTAYGSDTEGRIAAGGVINAIPDAKQYEAGNGDHGSKISLDRLLSNYGYSHIIANTSINNFYTYTWNDYKYIYENGDYSKEGRLFKRIWIDHDTVYDYDERNYSHYSDIDDHFYRSSESGGFDVAAEFEELVNRSKKLSEKPSTNSNAENSGISIVPLSNGSNKVVFDADMLGQTQDVVVFNCSSDFWMNNVKQCQVFEFKNIPNLSEPRSVVQVEVGADGKPTTVDKTWEYAYIVINVGGDPGGMIRVTDESVACTINDVLISKDKIGSNGGFEGVANEDYVRNNHYGVTSLLYNFYDAGEVELGKNFQGTIFAPNADAHDLANRDGNGELKKNDKGEFESSGAGHLSGALIAKSFWGKTEFGYRPYTGPISILGSTSGYTIPVDKFEANTGNHLSDAAFKLTITDQNGDVVTSWTSGDSTEYVTIPTMIDFTGDTVYTIGNNEEREYKVWEESAPEGYVKTDQSYQIKVTETIEELTQIDEVTLPAKVTVNIEITSNEAGNTPETLNFTISDEYSEDTQTMRKITINGKEFWLEIENQKVSAVGVPTDETERESYESKGTTTSTSIEHLTDVYSRVITETVMTDVTVTDENGDAVLDADSNPVTERVVATETVNTEDENGNSVTVYSTVTQVVTETVAVTAEDGSTVTVEGGSVATTDVAVTEKWSETNGKTTEHVLSEETIYVIYTDVQVTSTVVSPSQLTNKTEIILDGDDTRYYFDPNSLMFMPMPGNNLEFVNEYGFLFKKVDEGGDPVTGATIVLEKKNGEEYAEVKTITESSLTIDPKELDANTLYRFREAVVPNGYEAADPVYVVKISDGLIVHCESAAEPTIPTVDNYDGWTQLAFNDDSSQRTIKMEDQKIHGAELFLYKVKAGEPSVKLTNAEFELYRMGVAEVLDTFTIPKEGLDLTQRWAVFDTAYIKKGYLTPGSYYLKEIGVPKESGYAENSGNEYHFTVKPDFSIELGKKESVEIKLINATGNDANNVYFPSNANGNRLDGNNGALNDIVKIQIEASQKPRIYSNIFSGDSYPTQNPETGVYEYDFGIDGKSIDKFEIHDPDYNKDISITSVKFITSSGLQYVYEQKTVDYGDGISLSSQVLDFNSTGLSRMLANSDTNDTILKFKVNTNSGEFNYGNGYVNATVNGNSVAQNTLAQNAVNHGFGTVVDNNNVKFGQTSMQVELSASEICAITGASELSEISQFKLGLWNSSTFSDVEFTNITPTITGDSGESGTENTNALDAILTTDANSNVKTLSLPNEWGTHTSISVTKTWDVAGYVEFIPEDLTLTLYRKTENSVWEKVDHTTPTPTKQGTIWNYKYEKLPGTAEDGSIYYYKVEEQELAGFEMKDTNQQNGIESGDIELTNKLKTVSLNVQKKWVCPKGTTLPNSITISLEYSEDGEKWEPLTGSEQVLNAGNSWKYAYDAVPAGYHYRIVENTVLRGWQTTAETSDGKVTADGTTLTLTNKLSTGGLKIEKNWEGDSGNESNRPDKITVKLYRKAVAGGGSGGNAGGTVSSLNIAKVPISTTKSTDTDVYTDYSRLLQYSLYFYDANMCGNQVDENSSLTWRNDCHLDDEILGGFHDAGDHVMFGLPQGFTASTLGWSYYEFKDAYDDLGLTGHYQTIMKHFCDFFVASTDLTDNGMSVKRVLFQKGVGGDGYDHSYWGDPTNQPDNYNANNTKRSTSMDWVYPDTDDGSDFTSEYAAALAQYYLNFYDIDPVTADKYLSYAEKLYAFAKVKPGPTSAAQYGSDSYTDDMAWAAGWLYLATENETYKNDLSNYVQDWTYCWSDVTLGAASMYGLINGDWTNVTNYLDRKCNDANTYYIADAWGSARYNAALQMVALVATKHTDKNYTNWCKSQMVFLLGDNEIDLRTSSSTGGDGVCFIVGFADNSSKNPHHRASSGYNSAEEKGTNTQHASDGKTLVGALVGGPSNGGHREGEFWTNHYYYDNMQDYCCNEVALDYNAGLVGAAAGLYHFYKNDADVNKTFSLVTNTDDFGTKSGIETAYPTVVPTAQSLTLTPQQSEKANAIKGIAKVGSDVKVKDTTLITMLASTNDTSGNGNIYLGEITKELVNVKVRIDAETTFVNGVNLIKVGIRGGDWWSPKGTLEYSITGDYELKEATDCKVNVTKIENDIVIEFISTKVAVPNNNYIVVGNNYGSNFYVSGYEVTFSDGTNLSYGTFANPQFTIAADPKENIHLGGEVTMSYANAPEGTKSVVYTGDANQVSVDGNKITVLKPGDITITGTAYDNEGNVLGVPATAKIKVLEPTLSIPSNLIIGESAPIEIRGNAPTTGRITLQSDGGTITSNDDGTFTFTADNKNWEGNKVKITASYNAVSYKTYSIDITKLSFNNPPTEMTLGSDVQLSVNNSSNLEWSSSDPTIAAVDQNGKVHGVAVGTVTITAKDKVSGAEAKCNITVKDNLVVTIDKEILRVGDTAKLNPVTGVTYKAYVNGAEDTTGEYVTIADDGTVTAKKAGTVTITGTRNNAEHSVTLTIKDALKIIGDDTMNVNAEQTLEIENNIGDVTWELTEGGGCVEFDPTTRKVTAKGNGSAVITATDSLGSTTFNIRVELTAEDADVPEDAEYIADIEVTEGEDGIWNVNKVTAVNGELFASVNDVKLDALPLNDAAGNVYVYYIDEGEAVVNQKTVYVPTHYSNKEGVSLTENGEVSMSVTNTLKSSVETTGQMPSAGGEGNGRYYMAGAAMMLAGIAGYFVLKRRQRSRAEA